MRWVDNANPAYEPARYGHMLMQVNTLSKVLSIALAAALTALGICAYMHQPAGRSVPAACQRASDKQALGWGEIKHYASPNVGGMGMFEYKVREEAPPGFPAREHTVHPNVALWTPHGRLLGSDRGEFGGELVLSREDEHFEPAPEIILRDNIKDMFVTPHGIVVIAGLAHMGVNRGAVYLLNFSDSKPAIRKIYDLPSAVVSSWHASDQSILVNTRGGSYLIKSPTEMSPIECPARSE